VIHPPHLTLYAIVAATTCGASLVFLVFVSLYSIARALVPLMRWAQERGEGRRDLQPEKLIASLRRQRQWSVPGHSVGETISLSVNRPKHGIVNSKPRKGLAFAATRGIYPFIYLDAFWGG